MSLNNRYYLKIGQLSNVVLRGIFLHQKFTFMKSGFCIEKVLANI